MMTRSEEIHKFTIFGKAVPEFSFKFCVACLVSMFFIPFVRRCCCLFHLLPAQKTFMWQQRALEENNKHFVTKPLLPLPPSFFAFHCLPFLHVTADTIGALEGFVHESQKNVCLGENFIEIKRWIRYKTRLGHYEIFHFGVLFNDSID